MLRAVVKHAAAPTSTCSFLLVHVCTLDLLNNICRLLLLLDSHFLVLTADGSLGTRVQLQGLSVPPLLTPQTSLFSRSSQQTAALGAVGMEAEPQTAFSARNSHRLSGDSAAQTEGGFRRLPSLTPVSLLRAESRELSGASQNTHFIRQRKYHSEEKINTKNKFLSHSVSSRSRGGH